MADMPTPKQLDQLREEYHPLVEQSRKIKVKSEADAVKASEFVKNVNDALKAVEMKRKEYVGPLNDTVRRINADMKVIARPLEEAKATAGTEVMNWKRAEDEKARKEEERRRKIQESHAAKGHETAAPAYVPKPLKTTGHIQTKKVWKYRITDEKKVPRRYLVVNHNAVVGEMRSAENPAELKIAGIEFYQDDQMAVV